MMFKFKQFVILLSLFNLINCNVNLCTICKCEKTVWERIVLANNNSLMVINCDGRTNNNLVETINLEQIVWPDARDTKYFVKFHHLKKTYVPEINEGNDNVIGLDLSENSIRDFHEKVFQNFKYIEEITLSNNKLFGVEEWFKNNKELRHLGLSNTSISELCPHCVDHLTKLFELNLSRNSFTKLSTEFFNSIRSVQQLDLSYNKIFFIEILNGKNSNESGTFKLKYLNLSYNKLSVIAANQFAMLSDLQTLILQGNQISNVDGRAFISLNRMTHLDLSNNSLIDIVTYEELHSLHVLKLNNNLIKNWEMKEIPKELTQLYVQHNNLNTFSGNNFDNLTIFNISYNYLDVLPNIKFERLEILDLSYNSLTAVPQGMAERTPQLDTLILDHNPIPLIRFVDRVKLRQLSLNNMPLLKTIDYETFRNIEETGEHSSGNVTCLELEMSHCPYLSQIDENALNHINLCRLDLSYNNLSTLPQNLTDWTLIERGINLQGNPFICDCSVQWVLDRIVEQLYKNKTQQYLLRELRCNAPTLFAGKRFIKFYRRGDIFCHPQSAKINNWESDEEVETAGFNVRINLSQGPSYITIIISCIILLLVLIGFGLFWTHQQKKALRNNRRFT